MAAAFQIHSKIEPPIQKKVRNQCLTKPLRTTAGKSLRADTSARKIELIARRDFAKCRLMNNTVPLRKKAILTSHPSDQACALMDLDNGSLSRSLWMVVAAIAACPNALAIWSRPSRTSPAAYTPGTVVR